ncbi:MFS transporter [Actinomadura sediminis]|uniref:MFS transporter n=1 Tax=Actinomadura sediminis TaxID=1038904 RepID=A0ABW3ELM3_9ACTN
MNTLHTPAAAGRRSPRLLMPMLLVGNLLLFSFYGGVIGILLPLQVENVDAADKVTNLGIVTGIGAVFATLLNPIGGALSDRTRSRFGRRNPYLLGGAVLTLVFAAGMGAAEVIPLLIVGWCLAQGMGNVYQAALTAIVPDRVPAERRGSASAIMGIGQQGGLLLGIVVAGRFTGSILLGYVVLGAMLVAAAVLMAVCTHDPRPDELPKDADAVRPGLRDNLASFLSALRHDDFRWVFAGRALMIFGYFLIIGYLLYLLKDHIGVPDGMEPADGVAVITLVSTVSMIVCTAIGGPLSDRLDRRKTFVLVAGLGSAASLLLPLLSPNWATMLVFAALSGAFFGVYMAVDTAIVTLVLPRQEDAARDMGVLNMANAGPQIVAPFAAALVIGLLGGYPTLFAVAAIASLAGAVAILPVKGVR